MIEIELSTHIVYDIRILIAIENHRRNKLVVINKIQNT